MDVCQRPLIAKPVVPDPIPWLPSPDPTLRGCGVMSVRGLGQGFPRVEALCGAGCGPMRQGSGFGHGDRFQWFWMWVGVSVKGMGHESGGF